MGIALALYFTALPGKPGEGGGTIDPLTLTAVLVGITEPLEFTFLFISPLLFAVHAVLAASMATVMYLCGVVGSMGGGLLDQFLPQAWISCSHNHAGMMFTQIAVVWPLPMLYFAIFPRLILRFNLKTPRGREDINRLYTKADYKTARGKTTAASPETKLGQLRVFYRR